MKFKYLVTVLCLCFLLAVPLFTNIVPVGSAQTNSLQIPFQISYSMYNWTSDMNRLSMTTPETGLVFNITIYNYEDIPLLIGYSDWNSYYPNSNSESSLTILIQLSSSNNLNLEQPSKTISFSGSNELYLPPNTGESFFVEFDQNGNSFSIGSYTAEISYNLNSVVSYGYNGEPTGNTPIGQYPFNFQIETQQTLDNAIAQNPSPQTSHSPSLTLVSIVLIIAISAVLDAIICLGIIYFVVPRTRFKEKFVGDPKKKYQVISGVTGFIASIATIITLVLLFIH